MPTSSANLWTAPSPWDSAAVAARQDGRRRWGRPGSRRGSAHRLPGRPPAQQGPRGDDQAQAPVGSSRASATRIARSAQDSLGVLTWRWRTASWYQRMPGPHPRPIPPPPPAPGTSKAQPDRGDRRRRLVPADGSAASRQGPQTRAQHRNSQGTGQGFDGCDAPARSATLARPACSSNRLGAWPAAPDALAMPATGRRPHG